MLTQVRERMVLSGVPQITWTGEEVRAHIGEVRCALVHRTSEERGDNGMDRATETVYAVIPGCDAPRGGFRRGMELRDAFGGIYRMLVPVRCGGFWSVKCELAVR